MWGIGYIEQCDILVYRGANDPITIINARPIFGVIMNSTNPGSERLYVDMKSGPQAIHLE